MKRNWLYKFAVSWLALACLPAHAAAPPLTPLPETLDLATHYGSVADTLQELRTNPSVVFTSENGWTIATDESTYTIWSFAPVAYPAYPAVVQRQVIPVGMHSRIEMKVHCEATKEACDELVRTFAKMNGMALPQ